jgi:hypothetical protein
MSYIEQKIKLHLTSGPSLSAKFGNDLFPTAAWRQFSGQLNSLADIACAAPMVSG